MSAALTHVAVGLLLGLALGIRLRYLPAAGFLALLPDVDHWPDYVFWVPLLETRVTFHNVFFCVALPLGVLVAVHFLRVKEEWRRLAFAAPVILASHLFLDTLPLDVSSPRVPLFYPFSRDLYTASARRANAIDPTAYSTVTLLILILVALTVLTVLAYAWARRTDGAPRLRRGLAPAAFLVGWVLVFPTLGAAGYVIHAPSHPETILLLDEPSLRVPQSRFTAIVYHLGGNDVTKAQLRVEVLKDGARVADATNPPGFTKGDRWVVSLAVPEGAREGLEARLVATKNNHSYAKAPVKVLKGHVENPIVLASFTHDGRGNGMLRLSNDADLPVPASSLRALVTAPDGAAGANLTNAKAIPPRAQWTFPVKVPFDPTARLAIVVTGVEDGFVHLRDTRSPDLALPTFAGIGDAAGGGVQGVGTAAGAPRTDADAYGLGRPVDMELTSRTVP